MSRCNPNRRSLPPQPSNLRVASAAASTTTCRLCVKTLVAVRDSSGAPSAQRTTSAGSVASANAVSSVGRRNAVATRPIGSWCCCCNACSSWRHTSSTTPHTTAAVRRSGRRVGGASEALAGSYFQGYIEEFAIYCEGLHMTGGLQRAARDADDDRRQECDDQQRRGPHPEFLVERHVHRVTPPRPR